VNIGERLLGKNPIAAEVDEFVPDIIPNQWRQLHLTTHKANGKRLDMQFLRPLDWIKSNGAELGATIDLDLPEFGAKVVSIKACPPIKSGLTLILHQCFSQRFTLCRRQLHSQKFCDGRGHVEAEGLGEFGAWFDAVA